MYQSVYMYVCNVHCGDLHWSLLGTMRCVLATVGDTKIYNGHCWKHRGLYWSLLETQRSTVYWSLLRALKSILVTAEALRSVLVTTGAMRSIQVTAGDIEICTGHCRGH